MTQTHRSLVASRRRRGRVRCSTCSWCRNARISSWRAARECADVRRVWRTDRNADIIAQKRICGRPEQQRNENGLFSRHTHGHTPVWVWTKGKSRKGAGKLSPQSRALYRQIDLHFHDLRHEAGSRPLEAGWPLHEVQQMLGHASLEQTSTYLNATLRGLHRSMRAFDQARGQTPIREGINPPLAGNSCNLVASDHSCDPLATCKDTAPTSDKLLVN